MYSNILWPEEYATMTGAYCCQLNGVPAECSPR